MGKKIRFDHSKTSFPAAIGLTEQGLDKLMEKSAAIMDATTMSECIEHVYTSTDYDDVEKVALYMALGVAYKEASEKATESKRLLKRLLEVLDD